MSSQSPLSLIFRVMPRDWDWAGADGAEDVAEEAGDACEAWGAEGRKKLLELELRLKWEWEWVTERD